MNIKILGPGCRNCINLEKQVRKAVGNLGIDAQVDKVTDYTEIMSYGALSTPGLVVDGDVLVSGRVPKAQEIESLLTTN